MAAAEIRDFYSAIEETCTEVFRSGERLTPIQLLERLMDLPGLPMHCPPHHYIMPALLLTLAAQELNTEEKRFTKQLHTARQRALAVPGGFCGNCGNCGAAVGVGIFVSVFTGTTPRSREHWADCNRATGKALLEIASVDGPRCCKRNSFLALCSAVDTANEVLGLHLEKPDRIRCRYFMHNSDDCRREGCPFFPTQKRS